MPYRIDLRSPNDTALDRLVELGAIDAEFLPDGGIAALMPDSVAPEQVATALAADQVSVSPATGRDADSVWILNPRATRIGRIRIVPAGAEGSTGAERSTGALRLVDSTAFGTGLHPTTALCLEALDDIVAIAQPEAVLDVGTGSGVLALGALLLGVPEALGIDIDDEALRAAGENARINALDNRFQVARGGPETVAGSWPLVLANLSAASLAEMAPSLVRRVGHHGYAVLSGIPSSAESDVDRAYCRLGLRRVRVKSRAGWVALVLQASW